MEKSKVRESHDKTETAGVTAATYRNTRIQEDHKICNILQTEARL